MKITGLSRKIVKIKNRKFEYKLWRRRGTRSMRLAIYPNGNFLVTAPRWYPLYAINRFIEEKSEWIFGKLDKIDFETIQAIKKEENRKYQAGKESAKNHIQTKIKTFNRHYNFSYNRISVKNQRTCWGSASRKGNLNFNYKIIDLSEDLQDYIIVHELCHLKELNHSHKFWELVEKTMPDYKNLRNKLRNNRI